VSGESRMPVVITVDLEPDPLWPELGTREPWTGAQAWFEYVKRLRGLLEQATARPVHFTWVLRMDDQVAEAYGSASWVADAYGRELEALVAEGDELGVHPHSWRWQEPPGWWLQDHADDSWNDHVIQTSFNAFRESFGRGPTVHRFGSRFITAAIVRKIAELGFTIDMTIEPGARGMVALADDVPATGYLPDQTRAPRFPYRPSPEDPLRPADDEETNRAPRDGSSTLWMLPMSALDPAPWLPIWRRVARRARFAGQPLHRPAELWAPVVPESFWALAIAEAERLPEPYLSLAVRSDCLVVPILSGPVTSKFESLSDYSAADRMQFTTATEALGQLTGAE
jgi:hypothetical protein